MVKLSIKKPLTVFVAALAIIVLGVVAYTRMTPNLLPSMDFPYIVLMTTYAGATPEEVETIVTKPMEQAMATLDSIDTISSTSSENSSVVVLQFTEDVNMDTVTVDILQAINMISGYWDDNVGTPYILKINPDMLPVMVATVDYEGMDVTELSDFVSNTLMNRLEGIAGVASVDSSGIIEEQINIMLLQEKIDAINGKLAGEVEKQLDESYAELENAQKELTDAKAELEQRREELEGSQSDTYDEMSKMSAQINAAIANVSALASQETMLNASKTALEAERDAYTTNVVTPYEQLDAAYASIAQMLSASGMEGDFPTSVSEAAQMSGSDYTQYIGMLTQFGEQTKALTDMTRSQITELEGAKQAADKRLTEIETALNNLETELAAAAAVKQEAEAGLEELQSNYEQVSSGQMSASSGYAVGLAQMDSAQQTIEESQTQLDEAKQQLEDARASAIAGADISKSLSMSTIAAILSAQNFSMPAGYVTQDGIDYLVSVGDKITDIEELKQLLLFDTGTEEVGKVYLADVADVFISDNSAQVYAKVNGNNGVILTFNKQSTYATAEVTDNIWEKFDELANTYDGLEFNDLMNQGDYVYMVVDSLIQSLLFGALFAILILFLFLKDLRPTFITLCSIPLSVVFAVVLMYFTGVSINMISLAGLAVAVGMLVDNSVVVIENIYRMKSKGLNAVQAAFAGTKQVVGAIAASTLTTVCVFLPIVFVEGITRQLFTDMALTIAYALLASLVVAVTLVPAIASKILGNAKPKKNILLDKLTNGYRKAARFTLRFKPIVLILSLVLLVVSVYAAFSKGFIFMPSMNMPQLNVSITMPEGSTLDETKEIADEAMLRIMEVEDVETVGSMLAGSGMSSMMMGGGSRSGGSGVTMYVMLNEDMNRDAAEVCNEINELCADLPAEVTATASDMSSSMTMLTGSGISLNIYGEDLAQMQEVANDIAALITDIEGSVNVSNGIEDPDPVVHFTVDKEKAMSEGLTVAQVYQLLAEQLSTETSASSINIEGNDINVLVERETDELTPDFIKNVELEVTAQDGTTKQVKISDIAEITDTQTLSSITRLNQRRYVTVSAQVDETHNVTLITDEVERLVADYDLPAGISIEFTGENESIMDSINDLFLMLALGVLLIYFIMVAQFQSLKSPFIVMFTIPLAFTGGLFGLLITGQEVSVIAMIGFVMLAGIIVNNGIVLVDYINQLRIGGMEKREAIIEAGVTRMRPILMTSLTTILGLAVMIFSSGTGVDIVRPIAVVCIGGLIYATLLTLFVVPAMYDLVNRKPMKAVTEHDFEIKEITDIESLADDVEVEE